MKVHPSKIIKVQTTNIQTNKINKKKLSNQIFIEKKMRNDPPDDKWIKGVKFPNNWTMKIEKKSIKSKKCQPPAGDRPDLIQTESVPSWGLARPQKNYLSDVTITVKGEDKPPDDKWIKGVKFPNNWTMKNEKKSIKSKKCQPPVGDRPDLIQTESVPSRGLARPQKNYLSDVTITVKGEDKPPDDKWIKGVKFWQTSGQCSNEKKSIKSKKCQPAAGDRPDLIQTEPVPSRGLARPQKINRTKKSKNTKRNYLSDVTLKYEDKLTKQFSLQSISVQKNPVNKIKKCQPAAGDRPDLIQTEPVPSRGLARPQKKINRTKKLINEKRNYLSNVTLKKEDECTTLTELFNKLISHSEDSSCLCLCPSTVQSSTVQSDTVQKDTVQPDTVQSGTVQSTILIILTSRRNEIHTVIQGGWDELIKLSVISILLICILENWRQLSGRNEWISWLINWQSNVKVKGLKMMTPAVILCGRDEMIARSVIRLILGLSVISGGRAEGYKWAPGSKLRNKAIKITNGNGDLIKIVNWNLGPRLWVNKTNDIIHMLQDVSPDLAIISEANLQSAAEPHAINIPGYKLLTTKDYETGGTSRLVVLVQENFNIKVMEEKKEHGISTIWMEIPRKGQRPAVIGAIYREHHLMDQQQPNLTGDIRIQRQRWTTILNQWTTLPGGREVTVVGDLNLDFQKWTQPEPHHIQMIEEMKDRVETLGYTQMVKGPTRYWQDTTPSLIDHVWTNCPTKIIHCKNLVRPVADHNLVETSLRIKGNTKVNLESLRRDWKSLDLNEFRRKIEEMDWDPIYSIMDVNLANSYLEDRMRQTLDSMIPVRKIQPHSGRKSWVTEETKLLMTERDNRRQEAVATNREDDWKQFRKIRNKVTEEVRKDRKKHFQKMYSQAEDKKDSKSLFRITKDQLGWGGGGGPPTALAVEGRLLSKPSEMANILSEQFEKKTKRIKDGIPVTDIDPLKTLEKAIEKWDYSEQRVELEFREATTMEVVNIIKELSNSKTMGFDTMDSFSLKLVAVTVSNPIRHIVNRSISSHTFSNKWKLAKVIPLHKGGGTDRLSPENYRQISILSVISKITERVIQRQITEYMEETGQFNVNLHAYRNLHSTTTAALQMTNFIAEAADNHNITNAIIVDQSSAFDCVEPEILDRKLEKYKFSRNSRKWISSYLSGRSQLVEIGAAVSGFRSVPQGVPQGSVLGPVLYLMYTNDLPDAVKSEECNNISHNERSRLFGNNCDNCGNVTCFADDVTILTANRTRGENQTQIVKKMKEITEYLESNRLSINQKKTMLQEHMVKQKRNKQTTEQPVINVNTENGIKTIRNQVHTRILGLNLHQDLSWRSHLEQGAKPLLPTLRRRLGALRHMGNLIPRTGRKLLANGLIISKVIYMIQVWGGTQAVHMDKLQRIMNKTARYVINGGRRWKTLKLMKTCNWMTARELSEFYTLIAIWKVKNYGKPTVMSEMFEWNEWNEASTRRSRIQTTDNYFRSRSTRLWNQMTRQLRDTDRISTFKTTLRKWILDRRPPLVD